MLEQKGDILRKRKLHETDLELVKNDCHQILTKTEDVNIDEEEIPSAFKEELLEVQESGQKWMLLIHIIKTKRFIMSSLVYQHIDCSN